MGAEVVVFMFSRTPAPRPCEILSCLGKTAPTPRSLAAGYTGAVPLTGKGAVPSATTSGDRPQAWTIQTCGCLALGPHEAPQ